MHAVFLFDTEASSVAQEVLKDDVVSRQSISLRDAQSLGSKLEGLLVFIEGNEAAIRRFQELSAQEGRRLKGKEAKDVLQLLKKEEEDAAEGVGLLFG